MAARVALLILVTGLFAALWSGDHPDQLTQVRQPSKQIFRQDYDRETISNQSLSSSHVVTPLPEGISAGTYLVADRFGATRIRVVSTNDVGPVAGNSVSEPKSHYSVESRLGRWHYIRIEQGAGDQAAAPQLRQSR